MSGSPTRRCRGSRARPRRSAARSWLRRRALGPLLGSLLAAAACGPDAPREAPAARRATLRVEARHDLLVLLSEAEIESPLPRRMLLRRDTTVDARDGPGLIRAPVRTHIVFPPVTTSGAASVRVACGLADPLADDLPRTPVIFRIEAHDERGGPRVVEERFVQPVELRAPGYAADWRLELPGAATRSWTLSFSTRCPEDRAGSSDWPAWIAPRVVAEGRSAPRDEQPVRTWAGRRDLLAELDAAEVVRMDAAPPVVVERLDPARGAAWGGPRAALVTHGPTRLLWTLTPAAGSQLVGAVGVDQHRGWRRGSDGVTFAVVVDGERAWERRVDPASERDDRRWHRLQLDLSPWAGRAVTLELRSEPGGHARDDVAGWAGLAVRTPARTPRRAAGDGPNVFVVVVDTLRADRLGCYGAALDLTPRLDALAAEGLVFDRARSVSSWTLPATATLLTGLWPTEHGSLDDSRPRLRVELTTLAEHFAAAGWTTGAFVANPLVGRERDFDQGFETFLAMPDARAGTLVEQLLPWAEDHADSALLAYVHLLDPHTPYRAPPGFETGAARTPEAPGRALQLPERAADKPRDKVAAGVIEILADRDAYDAEVRYVDHALGELLDGLRARGLLDDALVLVTSDHGEEFLEHGQRYHGGQLFDESVKVPLLLAGFGAHALPAARSEAPATLRDVLPTLLALAGLPVPEGLPEPLLAPRPADAPQFAVTTRALAGPARTTDAWSLVAWPHKLLLRDDQPAELYDLSADPYELRDLAGELPGVVERLGAQLQAWRTRAVDLGPDAEGLDDDTRAWMEQLGYLGR